MKIDRVLTGEKISLYCEKTFTIYNPEQKEKSKLTGKKWTIGRKPEGRNPYYICFDTIWKKYMTHTITIKLRNIDSKCVITTYWVIWIIPLDRLIIAPHFFLLSSLLLTYKKNHNSVWNIIRYFTWWSLYLMSYGCLSFVIFLNSIYSIHL